MKSVLRGSLPVMLLLLLSACKKEAKTPSRTGTLLPNYNNVVLKNAFRGRDESGNTHYKEISDYYNKIWVQEDLSGGLLVAKGNQIIFEKYRGFARENHSTPITADTPMHVASVSKTLTAMAVMKLVEAGKVALTDPLAKYFPAFPYPEVTIKTLLTQRSGLPKYEYFIEKIKPAPLQLSKAYLTNQDVLDMLIKYKPELARPINTGFMYCNTNFMLLALVVEKVTQTPFPEAMQQMIFRPLHMDHTKIFTEKDIPTASQSFYYYGGKPFPMDRLDVIYGDKNVYTTPRDLFNFSQALFSKDFLRPELADQIFQPYSTEKPGVNNYGIGFRMKIFDNGEKLTYHNGWWHGSNAVFAHLLKSDVTIIAIGNKFSRRVYTALSLSSLFEDFPPEKAKLQEIMEGAAPPAVDPAQENKEAAGE